MAAPAGGVRDGHRETLKLCSDAGVILDEWQEFVVALWLRERRDGTLAARTCAENVPRQNGKALPLLAVALDSLFVSKLPLMIWTAHEFDTATEHYLALSGVCKGDPLLDAKVRNYYQSGQHTAIVLKNGNRVEFKARNTKRGRGFSAPRVVLDEAMFLTDSMMGALFPTMAAKSMSEDQPQLFYAGTAPLEVSTVWHRVRRRATSGVGAERLAYAEWSVDETDFDVRDRAGWAQANPGLGIRISEEFIADELVEIGEAEFVRERLGIGDPEPSEHGELALDQAAWASSFDGRSKISGTVTVALDVSPDGRLACLAVAGARADGLVHVEVLEHREPSVQWIVAEASRLADRWQAQVIIGPSAMNAYKPDLERADVPLVQLTDREQAAACVRFRQLVNEGQLRHLGSGELNAAVATAVEQPKGDGFVWRRRLAGAPDLSPLFAVTLAAWPQAEPAAFPAIY